MNGFWRNGGLAAVVACGLSLALAETNTAQAQTYRRTMTGFTPAPSYPGYTYASPPSYPGFSYAPAPTYFGFGPLGTGYYTYDYSTPQIWTSRYYAPVRPPSPAAPPASLSTTYSPGK